MADRIIEYDRWRKTQLSIYYVNHTMFGPHPIFIRAEEQPAADALVAEHYRLRNDGVPIQSISLAELLPLSLPISSGNNSGSGAFVFEDEITSVFRGPMPNRDLAELITCLIFDKGLIVANKELCAVSLICSVGLIHCENVFYQSSPLDWVWAFNELNELPELTQTRLAEWESGGTTVYRATVGEWALGTSH